MGAERGGGADDDDGDQRRDQGIFDRSDSAVIPPQEGEDVVEDRDHFASFPTG